MDDADDEDSTSDISDEESDEFDEDGEGENEPDQAPPGQEALYRKVFMLFYWQILMCRFASCARDAGMLKTASRG